MRARLGGLVASSLLLGASLGVPVLPTFPGVLGPEAAAAAGFTPDGRIAWADSYSGEGGLRSGKRTCENFDCDERRLTTDTTDEEPAWSPTGRQIAFSRQVDEHNRFIFVLDVVTGATWQVTKAQSNTDGFPVGTEDRDPTWSPDASTIAFGRSTELGVQIGFVAPGGGAQVRLLPDDPDGDNNGCDTFGALFQRSDPSFSPDGRISYDVNTIFLPGSSLPGTPLQLAGATLPEGVVASLAAESNCDHKGVWISGTDSHSDEIQVAPQLGQAWASAWSPDGTSIAMETNEATYVVPLLGGAPIVIKDSLGNAPHGTAGSGFFGVSRDGRVGWDPAGTFLLIDATGQTSSTTVKYKPDGTGDLDIAAGTSASHGVSVQCLPAECLTSFTIIRSTSGPGGSYPATFTYTGSLSGSIVLAEELFGTTGALSQKVSPGRITVTETTTSTWGLGAIECTAAATVDLAGRKVSVDVALGESVTCIFSTDLAPPLPSDFHDPGSSAGPPPTSEAGDCSDPGMITATYRGDWAAGLHGVDTLHFRVLIPWCYGNGRAALSGEAMVEREVGSFIAPSFISPILFKSEEEGLPETEILRNGDSIDVSAEGSFQLCSSVAILVSIGFSVFKGVGWAFSHLPGGLKVFQQLFIKRLDGLVLKLLKSAAQLTIFDELKRQSLIEEAADVMGRVFPFLDLAFWSDYDQSALPTGEFCRSPDTWHPAVKVTLHPDGSTSGGYDPNSVVSPFWDIKVLGQ